MVKKKKEELMLTRSAGHGYHGFVKKGEGTWDRWVIGFGMSTMTRSYGSARQPNLDYSKTLGCKPLIPMSYLF